MDNTAKNRPPVNHPAPTGSTGSIVSAIPNWRQNLISGLASLPTKARRLFADGYRIPEVPGVAGRFLVFKPKNQTAHPDYTLEVWPTNLTGAGAPRHRYRCTCYFYRTIAKYTALPPECKHGMAVVLRHENDVARVASAEALLARVAHIEGKGATR